MTNVGKFGGSVNLMKIARFRKIFFSKYFEKISENSFEEV